VRVALITPAYGPQGGGAGRIVQALARHLTEDEATGAEVILHTQEEAFAAEAVKDDVPVKLFKPPAVSVDYAIAPELWAYLRRQAASFDLIHVHGYRALPAVLPARPSRRPLVFSPYYHMVPLTRLRRLARHPYRQLARRAITSVDLAVCASRAEATELRATVPSLRDRIEVVPPGADIAAIQAAEPLPKLLTTIVTLGPLERGKRIDRVISTLPDLGPGYQLIIIGRGPERRALAAHAANLGVTQQVGFVGPVEDETLFRWLRTADVVVNMSDDSMSGGSLIEAACAGAPIVASDIAAHLEVAGRLDTAAVHIVSSQSSPLMLADEIRLALGGSGSVGSTPPVVSWADAADQTVGHYRALLASLAAESRHVRLAPAAPTPH
jgi:glycosyltransferase involved in cell wall biosynthesis